MILWTKFDQSYKCKLSLDFLLLKRKCLGLKLVLNLVSGSRMPEAQNILILVWEFGAKLEIGEHTNLSNVCNLFGNRGKAVYILPIANN